MPKIPVFKATRVKTAEVPGVRVPAEFGTAVFRELEETGREIQKMGHEFIESHRAARYAEGASRFVAGLNEVDLSLQESGETDEDVIRKSVSDLKTKTLSENAYRRDPVLQKRLSTTFDYIGEQRAHSLILGARKRGVDVDRAKAFGSLDSLEESFYNTPSPVDRSTILAQMEGIDAGMIASGAATRAEIQTLKKTRTGRMMKNSAIGDIQRDPEGSLEDLRADEYEGLEEADRLSLIEKAEKEVKVRKTASDAQDKALLAAEKAVKEEAIRARQDDFIRKLHDRENPLTVDEVLKSELDPVGAGSKDFFLKALEGKASAALKGKKGPFEESQPEIYGETLDAIYKGTVEDEQEILAKMGKGLSTGDTERLISEFRTYQNNLKSPTNTEIYRRSVDMFYRAWKAGIFGDREKSETAHRFYTTLNEFESRVRAGNLQGPDVEALTLEYLTPEVEKGFWQKVGQWFWGEEGTDEKPDPARHKGQIVRDTETGERFQSDGRQWVPVRE